MEKIHATQEWTNEQLELIEKYGTTDVYVLQEGVDFITDETGTKIIGTVNGEEGPWIDGVVVLPEGITSIGGFDYYLLQCDKLVCLSGFMSNVSNIGAQNFVFSDGCKSLWLKSNSTASYPQNITLDYSQNILNVRGYDVSGEIIFPLEVLISNPTIKFGRFEGSLRCMEPHLDFSNIQLFQNNDENVPTIKIHGYAGSTAEAFAKENGYNFVNIGSDYSIPINSSTATTAIISPNEYYSFTGISSLTVTLDTASTTKLDEFMFSFETPSDISSFSFGVLTDESIEIKWVKEPNLKPDYVYEVSVVNSVGVIAGTAKEVTE